jgi:hypothetical protein
MAKGNFKPHLGFASFFVVITIGLVLMLLNIGFTLGITFRIPTTNSNFTLAGCLGEKNKAINSLPFYLRTHLAGNNDFINHTMTTTFWKIEGCEMGIIGVQPGSPAFNIIINAK